MWVTASKLAVSLLSLLLTLCTGCRFYRALGKLPSAEQQQQFEKLPNYKAGQFQNQQEASIRLGQINWTRTLWDLIHQPATVKPSRPIPTVRTDLVHSYYNQPTVIWFGHSSFLLKTKTTTILVDPNFSGYAGPASWLTKAFAGSNLYQVSDLPPIDILLISHDHYDHLDYETILALKSRVQWIIVPKGVGAHFIYWGYNPSRILELNWYQTAGFPGQVYITATPARHESNRTVVAKKTLWASYCIQVASRKFFYSGDSGYGHHFAQIGRQYGPFDLALLECGQYGERWLSSHMLPAQTAQAAVDLRARMLLPLHWSKFKEAFHPWNEPVKRLLPAAHQLALGVTIPRIGEPYSLDQPAQTTSWWDFD